MFEYNCWNFVQRLRTLKYWIVELYHQTVFHHFSLPDRLGMAKTMGWTHFRARHESPLHHDERTWAPWFTFAFFGGRNCHLQLAIIGRKLVENIKQQSIPTHETTMPLPKYMESVFYLQAQASSQPSELMLHVSMSAFGNQTLGDGQRQVQFVMLLQYVYSIIFWQWRKVAILCFACEAWFFAVLLLGIKRSLVSRWWDCHHCWKTGELLWVPGIMWTHA